MTTEQEQFDVVVIGGGASGATAAGELARAGHSVLVVERGATSSPKVAGTLTGPAGDLVRDMGLAEVFDRRFLRKRSMQVRGPGLDLHVPTRRPTWHVRRDELDDLLCEWAADQGAEIRRGTAVRPLLEDGRVTGVAVRGAGADAPTEIVHARFLVDASGQSAFLSRHGVAGPRALNVFSRQIAAFAGFQGIGMPGSAEGLDSLLFFSEPLHWAWVLPLSESSATVGVAVPLSTYREVGQTPESLVEWGIERVHPELCRRAEPAERVTPAGLIQHAAYRIEPFVGKGWLCVGAAHRLTDPTFFFDLSLALHEGRDAARAVSEGLHSGDPVGPLQRWAETSERAQDAAQDLISYFWRFPTFFARIGEPALERQFLDLLGGESLHAGALDALGVIRGGGGEAHLQERARIIGERVRVRFADVEAVRGAFLEVTEDGACLSLVVNEDDGPLEDLLHEFEESLYRDFGRERLTVLRWSGEPASVLAPPNLDHAEVIFQRSAP